MAATTDMKSSNGSAQSYPFRFLQDAAPAAADDVASMNRFLARTEAGPDVPPPLDEDIVEAFAHHLGEAGEERENDSLAEAIRHGLFTDACAEKAAAWAEGTRYAELAAAYLALSPSRRRELCDAVAAMGSGMRP